MYEIKSMGNLVLIIVSDLDPEFNGSTLEYDDYLVKPVIRDELQTSNRSNCTNLEMESISASVTSYGALIFRLAKSPRREFSTRSNSHKLRLRRKSKGCTQSLTTLPVPE